MELPKRCHHCHSFDLRVENDFRTMPPPPKSAEFDAWGLPEHQLIRLRCQECLRCLPLTRGEYEYLAS